MNFTYFLPGCVVVLHIVIGGHCITFLFVNDQRNLQTEKRQFKISRVGKNPSQTCKWFFFQGRGWVRQVLPSCQTGLEP